MGKGDYFTAVLPHGISLRHFHQLTSVALGAYSYQLTAYRESAASRQMHPLSLRQLTLRERDHDNLRVAKLLQIVFAATPEGEPSTLLLLQTPNHSKG